MIDTESICRSLGIVDAYYNRMLCIQIAKMSGDIDRLFVFFISRREPSKTVSARSVTVSFCMRKWLEQCCNILKLLKSTNHSYRGKPHCIGVRHSFILHNMCNCLTQMCKTNETRIWWYLSAFGRSRYDHFGSSEIVDICHFLDSTIAREIKIWQNPAIGEFV